MMSEITSRKMTDLELAEQAKADLDRLEGRKRALMYELDEVQKQTVDAAAKAERTRFVAQRSGAIPEPPIPSLESMIEAAIKQCPHRNPHELAQMASRLHGFASGNSHIGVNVQAPMSPITGDEVRDTADHSYDIPPPTGPGSPMSPDVGNLPRYTKTYI